FGGATGYAVPRPSAFGFVFESDHSYYYLVCGLAILLGIFAKNLIRSRIGRAFIAIRDHDIAAEILGINVFRYKLLAFAVGCFYAGVAGTLLGHFYLYVNIESFPITDSIWYLGMVIVGGMGSIMGSVFGAVFLTILQEISITLAPIIEGILPEGLAMYQMQAALGWLFYGIVIIVFVIFEPRGLAHRWQLMKASYRLNPFPY
ncbi:MAG: branched-chain amino acid ABC transporter permease, partial [Chloroflexota bacterium]|nr:branched-chain amino acid ABC transporter permease [Chloroflexota bacterium]